MDNKRCYQVHNQGEAEGRGEDILEKFSPPWKNILDVV